MNMCSSLNIQLLRTGLTNYRLSLSYGARTATINFALKTKHELKKASADIKAFVFEKVVLALKQIFGTGRKEKEIAVIPFCCGEEG